MAYRVIVVGAGITGLAAAEWLRRDGWQVTVIDRTDPGDPSQASWGNAGLLARAAVVPVSGPGLILKAPAMLADPLQPLFLRWSYLPRLLPWLVPFLRNGRAARVEEIVRAIAPLTHDTVDQHRMLAAGTGAETYIEEGEYAFLYRDRAAFEKDAYGFGLRRAQGLTWEEREGRQLTDRDGALGPRFSFAAVFRDHGWITDPGGYVAALARHFVAEGGAIRKAEVVDIAPGRVTVAGGEVYGTDRIVLASGIWSRKLAERLGHKVPLETERGYHLTLKNPTCRPPFPCMVTDGKFLMTPMRDGLRLAGVVEFGGTEAGPSEAPFELLRHHARAVYPGLEWEAEDRWMGFRPTFPDSLPMLGESAKAPGIIFAFGSQHIGLTIGPRLGRMVADIAAGRHSNLDLSPYAPGRFS